MKRLLLLLTLLAAGSLSGRAATGEFSAARIDDFDRYGYLTPAFKTAVHELIDAKQALRDAKAEQDRLAGSMPELQKKVATEEGKVAALQKELASYDHPDENEFAELMGRMKDASVPTEEQMALAQAYVWTYPASPHQTEAQQELSRLQKKIGDQAQAVKDADAKRMAAQADLIQRAHAKELTLAEWRAFLQDKTQAEVVGYMGHPTSTTAEYWNYDGVWTVDPVTKKKVGLHLTFNGGHVLSVAPVPVEQ